MRHGSALGRRRRSAAGVQVAAVAVAAAFAVVGMAGFIPGLTTNTGQLDWLGRHDNPAAQPELLGIFHVSILHNLVHAVFGLAGLVLARTARGATTFLIGGGIVYALVLAHGLVIDLHGDANVLPVNTADNWLHAGLSVAMLALGVGLGANADLEPPATARTDPARTRPGAKDTTFGGRGSWPP